MHAIAFNGKMRAIYFSAMASSISLGLNMMVLTL